LYDFCSPAAPGDYMESAQNYTFSPTNTKFSLTIAINNDNILEETRAFFVRAALLSSDAASVTIDPNQAVVTIEDEDSKYYISNCGFTCFVS
jgi:hypothetical protein